MMAFMHFIAPLFAVKAAWLALCGSRTLAHVHAGLAASPYIGVRLAYELPLPLKFALALRAEGRADLWPAEFDVEGLSGGVSTLRWGGGVALALSRVFF